MSRSLLHPARRDFLRFGSSTLAAAMLAPNLLRAAPDPREVALRLNEIERTRAMTAIAKVELRRSGAKTRLRDLELSVARQGSKNLSDRRYVFLAPSDIKDTKLLVQEQNAQSNKLWLYLPSIGKPRRISAAQESNAFAGTDFSYANLMTMRVDNFSHVITDLNSKTIVLESKVKSNSYGRNIGYARAVTRASAGSYVPYQIDYFDHKGRHLKTQKMSSPARTPDGKVILRSRHMVVHGKGRETLIRLSNLSFSPRFGGGHFRSQNL